MRLPRLFHLLRYSVLGFVSVLSGCSTPIELPRTTEHDAALPSITLDGYRFHAEVYGERSKPPLIVLHGGPGADYRYLLGLRALADQYRVLFYDQRGSGLSPRTSEQQLGLENHLADLDAMVEYLGQGRPVHLVGHSWGAMLASSYTGRFPHKVQRLVLAEPGFLDPETQAYVTQGGWPGWPVVRGVAAAWLGQWRVASEGDPQARRDYLVGQLLPVFQAANTCDGQVPPMPGWRAGSAAFDATVGRMRADPDYAASLNFRAGVERFTGPVLLLAGSCSVTMGTAQQERHRTYFRHAQLHTLANSGHDLFNDQPEAALLQVRQFLAGPNPAPSP